MRVRLRARIFNDFWYRLINGYFSPTLSLHILRDKEKFIIRELGRASTALPSWMAPPNALRAKRKPQTQRSKRSERSDAELSTDFFIIIFYVSPRCLT